MNGSTLVMPLIHLDIRFYLTRGHVDQKEETRWTLCCRRAWNGRSQTEGSEIRGRTMDGYEYARV
jgi:hypothetical protein